MCELCCACRGFPSAPIRPRAPTGPLAQAQCHPRTYGTFPRLLGKYVREEKILTWELAIAKMTSAPARMLGLERRGEVRVGLFCRFGRL